MKKSILRRTLPFLFGIFGSLQILYGQSTTIINYQNWGSASGCNIFASATNVPTSVDGNANTAVHQTRIGQPTYSGGTTKAVALECRIDNGIYKGTEYRITYNFKKNYRYQITINASALIAGPVPPSLRLSPTNGSSITNILCNGPELIDHTTFGTLISTNSIISNTFADYSYIFSLAPHSTTFPPPPPLAATPIIPIPPR